MKVRVLDWGVLQVNESTKLAGELIERQADSSLHPQDHLKNDLVLEKNGASV